MANLIIHDTFEPYYAERDASKRHVSAEGAKSGRLKQSSLGEREISLPLTAVPEAPASAAEPWRKRAPHTH